MLIPRNKPCKSLVLMTRHLLRTGIKLDQQGCERLFILHDKTIGLRIPLPIATTWRTGLPGILETTVASSYNFIPLRSGTHPELRIDRVLAVPVCLMRWLRGQQSRQSGYQNVA